MFYESDLVHIHVDGYGLHCRQAAPVIVHWLCDAGIRRGTVVDLGCGGGQWLARLAAAGYSPVGVDISRDMIRRAREAAPTAKLICGSIAEIDLPACDAATAIGEPLNYLANVHQFRLALQHVHRALRPGGLFIFDVRERATTSVGERIVARKGRDWACIAEIHESATGRLVRQITTFRQRGKSYRRGAERRQLQLYSRRDMLQWLREIGFRVRTQSGYGKYQLGPRQIVFIARKPRT